MDDGSIFPSGIKISAVLPASGNGERFGTTTPKQYSTILNEPAILYTLSSFQRISFLEKVVVVVNHSYVEYVRGLAQRHGLDKVTVVQGSEHRHRSIFKGIKALDSAELKPDVVIIHDAVRLFAEESLVQQVALAAHIHGAAGVVRPLVSTVIAEDADHFLTESLDRRLYKGSEMPQAFQFNVICQAYQKATEFDFEHGTECLLLAQKYTNTRAKLIPGPDYLWKVTYKKDLYAAEGMLKEQYLLVDVRCQGNIDEELIKGISAACAARGIKAQHTSGEDRTINPSSNSVVVVCTNFDRCRQSLEETASVMSTQDNTRVPGVHLQPCVIHVYCGASLTSDQHLTFMDQCWTLGQKHPAVITYGILYQVTSDKSKICELTASLLWNRDTNLSGQTFIIR